MTEDYKDYVASDPSYANAQEAAQMEEQRVQAELTSVALLGTLLQSKLLRDLPPPSACYVLAHMSAVLASRVMQITPESYADWSKAIYSNVVKP